jgi:hypothetical protein
MTERKRIAGLAEQIELARKHLDEWPEWLRSNAHFSGSNHMQDTPHTADDTTCADPHAVTSDV